MMPPPSGQHAHLAVDYAYGGCLTVGQTLIPFTRGHLDHDLNLRIPGYDDGLTRTGGVCPHGGVELFPSGRITAGGTGARKLR